MNGATQTKSTRRSQVTQVSPPSRPSKLTQRSKVARPSSPSLSSRPSKSAQSKVSQASHQLRPARLDDVGGIYELLAHFSRLGELLPRTHDDVCAHFREFVVVEDNDDQHGNQIVACAALQIFTEELGEVRSLAVAPRLARLGLGRRLVAHIEAEARALGLRRLMALTYVAPFFHTLGFATVEMRELPEKVWGVCINCPKFLKCDEIAVLKLLSQGNGADE